jgi:PAS domain S-box-containing protein
MRRLEDELLELGGDIAEALENVPVPATLLTPDGTIRWQNKASIDFRGNHVGERFAELVAPDEQDEVRDRLTRMICHGEPAEMTIEVRDAHGGYTPVQLSAVPVREGGAIVAIFGVGHVAERPPFTHVPGISLTGRQLNVLRLLSEGASTDEIASRLSLSVTTVRNHIANLLAALGVHSRLQAVVAASKAGLLEPLRTSTDDAPPTSEP